MMERIPFQACPLCNDPRLVAVASGDCSGHPLYQKSISPLILWKRCENCSHVFTEGYFSEEACELIFSRANEAQAIGYDIEGQRHISARIIEKILPFASSGNWLDVGLGNGSLLFTAQEFGFTPIGVDVRQENTDTIAALGIKSYCADFTKLHLDEMCSVISMADVLEHMPFPKEGLRATRRLLLDGGLLFLSMPNMESVVWKVAEQNKANPYWSELEHYHNFTRTRLYSFLHEEGFEPLRYGVSERYRACMEIVARKA